MKMQNVFRKVMALAVAAALLMSVCACGSGTGLSGDTVDLMKDIKPSAGKRSDQVSEQFVSEYRQFAFTLFQQTAFEEEISSVHQDKSLMISPLSVMPALAMTANGADGETAAQMTRVLTGQPSGDMMALNDQWSAFAAGLPSSKKAKLSMANSIWLRDGVMEPDKAFLQTNRDSFNADIFSAKFDDGTVKDINGWVSRHTDGMIDKMLDNISGNAMMFLINALAFDAEWQEIYTTEQVRKGTFHGTIGDQKVEMMGSDEDCYLEDDKATGFIKPYASGYSFMVMLPNEGVSVGEYIGGWSAEKYASLLAHARTTTVSATIPKFSQTYEADLNNVLRAMGITDAFEAGQADFSRMGQTASGEKLYISRVQHKTFVSVDERGTKAGAATSVSMDCGSAMMIPVVYCDRPFVYCIIENETQLPVFMGAVMNVS